MSEQDHKIAVEQMNGKRYSDWFHSKTPPPDWERDGFGWDQVVIDALNSEGVPAHYGDAVGCVRNILEAQEKRANDAIEKLEKLKTLLKTNLGAALDIIYE